MTTDRAGGPNASGRMVLAFLAFVLLAIFGASFVYRLERPSLEVHQKKSQAAMPDAMNQAMNGPMKEVMALMQKLQENPEDPGLQLAMAERFMAMGSFDRAKTFLDKVGKVRPDDPDVLNALGVTLYNLKDLEGAKAAFETILSRNAGDYRALFNLALLNKYALNQPEKAAAGFKAVIASPDADPETKATAQKELEGKAPQ
ncbi:tetratricopeptide repeat protein [Solidesulfovibrio sp.]|uniref:tetratricopeptide repeat protein n=1 Tax=Solidesulfovibrio sp. TaxID=2910990 RepID=UPI002B217577|nr:tetratricopeptide repeat protein [Solidesulfovibrio sp.]MEA4855758.1 tetratricopeptide repeat protein [Solidesulfovibrio sp.]